MVVMLRGTPAFGRSGLRSACVTCTGKRPESSELRDGVHILKT